MLDNPDRWTMPMHHYQSTNADRRRPLCPHRPRSPFYLGGWTYRICLVAVSAHRPQSIQTLRWGGAEEPAMCRKLPDCRADAPPLKPTLRVGFRFPAEAFLDGFLQMLVLSGGMDVV